MKFLSLILCFFALSTSALAQRTELLVNHENVRILTGTGKQASAEEFKAAVRRAAAKVRGQWQITDAGPDKLSAMLTVRRHSAVVAITYKTENFSVIYRDSTNLNYKPAEEIQIDPISPTRTTIIATGQYVIHANYNRWVKMLIDAIRMELHQI